MKKEKGKERKRKSAIKDAQKNYSSKWGLLGMTEEYSRYS